MRSGGSWFRLLLGLALLLISLIVANVVGFWLRPNTLFRLDVGFWGDQDVLRGMYEQESTPAGATYRWTGAESRFFVRSFAAARHAQLMLDIGGLPQSAGPARPVNLTLDGTAIKLSVAAAPRQYRLFLPRNALLDGNFDLTMTSPTSVDAPDVRALGFRLDAISLGWSADPWVLPTLPMLLAQAAVVVVWLLLAWRLEWPRWSYALITVAGVSLMAGTTSYKLMMAMAWQMRLLAFSMLGLALAWRAYDRLERWLPGLWTRRELRLLVGVGVLAIGLRIFAIMFPPFGSHDLYIHRERLQDVQRGALFLYDTPSEFAGQRTTVPPAYYVLASPFTLLTADASVALQGLYALLEGSSPLLIAMVVRQLGFSSRAALAAALVAVGLPIQITILWWGFGPQVLSQWLLLLLLVWITRPARPQAWFWIGAGLILTLALLSHNGAVVLGGCMLAAYVALLWLLEREERWRWRGWGALLIGSSALAVLVLYGNVLVSQLAGAGVSVSSTAVSAADESARIGRVWGGLRASFRPLGYTLAGISLVALVWRTPAPQRWAVLAWLASAVIFLGVDLALGLQVRYAYFVIPLLCAGIGVVLDAIMRWRVVGSLVATALVIFVCIAGVQALYAGVFLGIKPTLTALTH